MVSKCDARLKGAPNCGDRREKMGWIFCRALQLVRSERMDMSPAVKKAWAEVKEKCPR